MKRYERMILIVLITILSSTIFMGGIYFGIGLKTNANLMMMIGLTMIIVSAWGLWSLYKRYIIYTKINKNNSEDVK